MLRDDTIPFAKVVGVKPIRSGSNEVGVTKPKACSAPRVSWRKPQGWSSHLSLVFSGRDALSPHAVLLDVGKGARSVARNFFLGDDAMYTKDQGEIALVSGVGRMMGCDLDSKITKDF